MMKKNGFTLAEVLITLAIIGVVATMTLPTLMTNTGEQQAKTGLKKGINILTEAAQMHETLEGYNFASLTGTNSMDDISTTTITGTDGSTANVNGVNSLVGLLKERTKIDYSKTKSDDIQIGGAEDANAKTIVFADGTALIFDPSAPLATDVSQINAGDNLPNGFKAIFDTNGAKGPNLLSNCVGLLAGGDDEGQVNSEGEAVVVDVSQCNDKAKRVIKDQFQIQLRGNVVQPVGAAATWAFAN